MELMDALVLGILQGIGSVLPISLSGHAILLREWFSLDDVNRLAFSAFGQFSVAAAFILYFSKDFLVMTQAVLRRLGRLPVNRRDLMPFYALVCAVIPAAIFGVFIEPMVETDLKTYSIMAALLLTSSLFLMFVEWKYYVRSIHEEIAQRRGIVVGLFQAIGLLPGFSSVGMAMGGGMISGMSRYASARFTFTLLVPLFIISGSRSFVELLRVGGTVAWGNIIIGSIVAFFVSLLTASIFLRFINRGTLWPFIWYSVILSGLLGYVALITP